MYRQNYDWRQSVSRFQLVRRKKDATPPLWTGTKDILCMLPKYIIIYGFRSPLGQKMPHYLKSQNVKVCHWIVSPDCETLKSEISMEIPDTP